MGEEECVLHAGGPEALESFKEALTPPQWQSASSQVFVGTPGAEGEASACSISQCHSVCGWEGGSREEGGAGEELPRRRTPTMQWTTGPPALQEPPRAAGLAVGMRRTPELGASAPLPAAAAAAGVFSVCGGRGCSNPLAHRCNACRQREMEETFNKAIPGYLAAETHSPRGPCCSLSSAVHTIVHVCDCMPPFELDSALAVENLRLERVRDAHAVVLTLAQKYGVSRVLEDANLTLILYKYDEMSRMYAMMGAPVCYRRRHSYFRRVTSSLLLEGPGARKKRQQPAAEEEQQAHSQELPQDPALAAAGLGELDERLRNGMRQLFGMRSLGTLTNGHVPPADASWHLAVQDGNGLKIFFRRHASSTLISFRVEGTVDSSVLNIVSVLNEMDLYKEWIPYYSFPLKLGLREVKKLYELGRTEHISLLHLDFPWPMNNRDCCVDVWAVDDLDYTNRFFVRITTLDGGTANPRLPLAVPMPPQKTLRLYCEGAVILVPLKPQKTFIELFWTLDPKVHLSDYIVNFFTKVFAKSSFHAFCKVCADASGGEHARRRQKCPLLYGFIEKRLQEVEKAYEKKNGDGQSQSPSQEGLTADSSHASNNFSSSRGSASPTHPKNSVDSSASEEKEREATGEATQVKRSRSGRRNFPFRKGRAAMPEAARS
ncbi:hypothetical protein Efla_006310 [Eimeria flavescens]